jgi:short-subunit dehydrogenase
MSDRSVAVVTGAAGGLGRGLAVQAATSGLDVAVCDIDEGGLEQTAALVRRQGRRCTAVVLDIRDADALSRFEQAVHGDIELVIANAGVLRIGPFVEMSHESLDLTIDVNLRGVLATAMVFLPRMIRQPTPSRLLLVGSEASYFSFADLAAYSTTKAGIRAFAEALRAELTASASPVDVSLVAPGPIKTGILRHAASHDVAGQHVVPSADVFPGGLMPEEAARIIFERAAEGRFLISTHPGALAEYVEKSTSLTRSELDAYR